MKKPALRLLDSEFTIYRFQPNEPVPSSVYESPFYWLGKTEDELSVVCDSSLRLVGGKRDAGWSCFQVLGPIELSSVGVLAGMAMALASAQISTFAISTFDTDYLLVKTARRKQAIIAMTEAGYKVQTTRRPGKGGE